MIPDGGRRDRTTGMAHLRGVVSSRRWIPSAALAALAHVAVFAAAGRIRPPAVPAFTAPPERDEVALDLGEGKEAQEPQAPEVPAAKPSEIPAGSRPAGRGAKVAARAAVPSTEPGPVGEPGTAEPAPAPAASDDGWTFNPSRPADMASPFLVAQSARGIASEEAAQRPPPSAGRLAEALDQRDAELGIGRGGPVLTALENASRGMDVPAEGWATFDVAIDTSGRVSVALGSVSGEHAAWSRVASTAAAAVDPSRVRIPPGARGWHVVVRVDAKVQFPDGRRPRDLGARFEATPGKLSSTSMVVEKTPSFTISYQGKVCGVGLHVDPLMVLMPVTIGGGCNPEDAGMPAVRMVSGHIVSEGRL
jgi:hypothetical protein